MLNIPIISDEAKGLASLFRSTGFTVDTQDLNGADAAKDQGLNPHEAALDPHSKGQRGAAGKI